MQTGAERSLGVIVLAAGVGKRMHSQLPKVLHTLGGKPLLKYCLDQVRGLRPERISVVIGSAASEVQQACGDGDIHWVFQAEQLGTGHAVACTRKLYEDFAGDLLILNGDVPLLSSGTLKKLLAVHRDEQAELTLLTACLAEPGGYGRILRGTRGELAGVIEDRDASEAQKAIEEVNAGVYVVSPGFVFPALEKVTNRNSQGEYYLPDIVAVALAAGKKVRAVRAEDEAEILGINTREELATMEKYLVEKINRKWMAEGVTLKDPGTIYIEDSVVIGRDTVIGPNTQLLGQTVIGKGCRIDGSAYVSNTWLGEGVHLKFSVVLTDCEVGEQAQVGPFAHVRPGTVLKRDVHVGTFVEVKNSLLQEGTKANHLSYIGDTTVGREANIGAGTITCNFDGFEKYRTVIGDRVQVGSDTQLVAPVKVGDDAYIGAGSTITEDVPAGSLALSRVAQKHILGWVERFRARHKQKPA